MTHNTWGEGEERWRGENSDWSQSHFLLVTFSVMSGCITAYFRIPRTFLFLVSYYFRKENTLHHHPNHPWWFFTYFSLALVTPPFITFPSDPQSDYFMKRRRPSIHPIRSRSSSILLHILPSSPSINSWYTRGAVDMMSLVLSSSTLGLE